MLNSNIPDLLEICKNDHSLAMKVIDNYVKVVSTENDKDLKQSILENLQNLTKNLMESSCQEVKKDQMMIPKLNLLTKDSNLIS